MFGKQKKARQKGVNLFFATDLHGSNHCFKKFLSAPTVYGADVLVLGGDLTGKLAVPIVRQGPDAYRVGAPGGEYEIAADALEATQEQMVRAGWYPFVIEDADELDAYRTDPARVEARMAALMDERLVQWGEWAGERLADTDVEILVAPGNDDPGHVDAVLRALPRFRLVESEVVDDAIPGLPFQLLSTGVSNPTPWKTHREVEEEELEARLDRLAQAVSDPEHAIFNIHVPPYGSRLDDGPLIDHETLKVTSGHGHDVTVPVGSTAVKNVLERYGPLLSLHGHIHESRGIAHIGRTVAINPGSDYSDGVLRGAFVTLSSDGIENYQLTTG